MLSLRVMSLSRYFRIIKQINILILEAASTIGHPFCIGKLCIRRPQNDLMHIQQDRFYALPL